MDSGLGPRAGIGYALAITYYCNVSKDCMWRRCCGPAIHATPPKAAEGMTPLGGMALTLIYCTYSAEPVS